MMNESQIRVVHLAPGRIRLKVAAVKSSPAFARRICQLLLDVVGIEEVEIREITGSVLVRFDVEQLQRPNSLEQLRAAMKMLFPDVDTGELEHLLLTYTNQVS